MRALLHSVALGAVLSLASGCVYSRHMGFEGETVVGTNVDTVCPTPGAAPVASAGGDREPSASAAASSIPASTSSSASPASVLVGLPLMGSQLEVLGEIEFDPNSAVIRETPHNIGLLTTLAAAGRQYPQITRLRVEGHTDSDGDDASNQDLSERRAQSVASWLVQHGIERERLAAIGCGERDPVATNATSEGKQRNRRTEFDIEDVQGKRWNLATEPCAPNPQRRAPNLVVTK